MQVLLYKKCGCFHKIFCTQILMWESFVFIKFYLFIYIQVVLNTNVSYFMLLFFHTKNDKKKYKHKLFKVVASTPVYFA